MSSSLGRCLNGCILRRDRGRGDTRLVDRTDAAINEAIAADPGVHNVTITVPTMRTRAGGVRIQTPNQRRGTSPTTRPSDDWSAP
ncbi:MAG: hypothetical protein H0W40_18175 [Methylibium sp.]|uniref:hypothetical protein n=1 Tax=Methylibium sp. TaxID=2067992 RepID=UPI0017C7DEA1|nr:hypothetical protein [Methylibium sp.]MBA3599280.1 hypothetical protein [Methylibium sp.]